MSRFKSGVYNLKLSINSKLYGSCLSVVVEQSESFLKNISYSDGPVIMEYYLTVLLRTEKERS